MGLVFPTEVWTALLNYGYVGCIRDLFIDGQSKDVRRLAEVQKAAGVKPSCSKEPPKQCLSNPCQNNGVCREGWNRYVCDCSGTGYLGRSCERGRTLFFSQCFYPAVRKQMISVWWAQSGFVCVTCWRYHTMTHFYLSMHCLLRYARDDRNMNITDINGFNTMVLIISTMVLVFFLFVCLKDTAFQVQIEKHHQTKARRLSFYLHW